MNGPHIASIGIVDLLEAYFSQGFLEQFVDRIDVRRNGDLDGTRFAAMLCSESMRIEIGLLFCREMNTEE